MEQLHGEGMDALSILNALSAGSGGKIDTRCTATVQAALVRVVREVGYTLPELEVLGREAARAPEVLWPWAAAQFAGRRKVTLSFLLGKRGEDGRYEATPLTDGMARVRPQQPSRGAKPASQVNAPAPRIATAEEAARVRPSFMRKALAERLAAGGAL